MNTSPTTPSEDLRTRWIDGELSPKEAALLERQLTGMPELISEREAANQLRDLLRKHLPAKQEPPSPDFFTSSVMDAINCSPIVRHTRVAPERSGLPSWLSWMRSAWFGPLASAAVVAVAFVSWNHLSSPSVPGSVAQTISYTPDPSVVANSYFSDDAGATVIDLQNLAPLPNDREIRAFDVASADPALPGEPVFYYAATNASQVLFVRSTDASNHPLITAVH